MRFLISSIFTIFILSIPSVVFGEKKEVKDIGVICKPTSFSLRDKEFEYEDEIPFYTSIWFLGEKKMERYHRDKYDKDGDGNITEFVFDDVNTDQSEYNSTEDTIWIWYFKKGLKIKGTYGQLDRYTLEKKEISDISVHKSICEVHPTKEQFLKGMEGVEKKLKEILNKRKI